MLKLGRSKEIVVAWWGSTKPPEGHILAEEPDVNSIVWHPLLEDSMYTETAKGWVGFLLRKGDAEVKGWWTCLDTPVSNTNVHLYYS